MSILSLTPPEVAAATNHVVEIGGYAVGAGGDTIATSGLGSCVALILVAPGDSVAGLAHFLLPEPVAGSTFSRPARFVSAGIPLLVSEVRLRGAFGDLQAKLVGGARMFSPQLTVGTGIGQRNLDVARAVLARLRIPVVATDTGGDYGRSVCVDVTSGRVAVRSLSGRQRDI